jgi:hypothetical protein
MANTTEMLRLMRHAADLLDACEPMDNAEVLGEQSSMRHVYTEAVGRAVAESAAIITASMILRMVAAAMDDEPATAIESAPR